MLYKYVCIAAKRVDHRLNHRTSVLQVEFILQVLNMNLIQMIMILTVDQGLLMKHQQGTLTI